MWQSARAHHEQEKTTTYMMQPRRVEAADGAGADKHGVDGPGRVGAGLQSLQASSSSGGGHCWCWDGALTLCLGSLAFTDPTLLSPCPSLRLPEPNPSVLLPCPAGRPESTTPKPTDPKPTDPKPPSQLVVVNGLPPPRLHRGSIGTPIGHSQKGICKYRCRTAPTPTPT
jgi:hypothetical protein